MRYIVGPGFTAQEDHGFIRVYHKATIEEQDIGTPTSDNKTTPEKAATPVRAKKRTPGFDGRKYDNLASLVVTKKKSWLRNVAENTFVVSMVLTCVGITVASAHYLFSYINAM